MTIKPYKSDHILFACLTLFLSLLSVYVGFDSGSLWAIVLFLPIIIFILDQWVIACRTLIMDKTGCTIRFWIFSRFWAWESLETRKIVYFQDAFRFREPYVSGVVFSSKKQELPRRMTPGAYNLFNSPFNYFYVYFDLHPHTQRANYTGDDTYLVDKYQFLAMMRDWRVELEEAIQ